ncbi:MAG TPA: protein glxC [Reyranella sp.]|nr:protein glxC [Reyranella sp.]
MSRTAPGDNATQVDLTVTTLRELNAALHKLSPDDDTLWQIANPRGLHAIAAGLDAPVTVEIDGAVGYYCGGMNKQARIVVNGNAGVGVGENIMSGLIHVKGDASQAAGATGCGGMLIIDGNASARCGISMKGVDIVVKGSIGHMSAFMAQAGTLAVLGDAGDALGDSLYEARLFVRGSVASLGADCIEKEMREEHKALLAAKLEAAGILGEVDISEFRRYGSARTLYHFHVDNVSSY